VEELTPPTFTAIIDFNGGLARRLPVTERAARP
jgi:hypothetical protein